MLCIDCRTELKKRPLGAALIDTCPNCGGQWLDAGELAQVDTQAPSEQLVKQAFVELQRERRGTASKNLCPRCQRAPLSRHVVHGVVLDRCPSCEGLWFDAGELEKVRAAQADQSGISGWLKSWIS
jgi:Zn-finger nucleic acid-binding protein